VLRFKTTKQFEGDYKLMVKRGKDIEKLKTVMRQLVNQQSLESRYHDHALTGNLRSHRDCHIEPDWILIYRTDRAMQEITFVRTGSHADLFG
jgi:mRNA interferase YafQ